MEKDLSKLEKLKEELYKQYGLNKDESDPLNYWKNSKIIIERQLELHESSVKREFLKYINEQIQKIEGLESHKE